MVFVPAVLTAVKGRAAWGTVVLVVVMVGGFPYPGTSSYSVSPWVRSRAGNKAASAPGLKERSPAFPWARCCATVHPGQPHQPLACPLPATPPPPPRAQKWGVTVGFSDSVSDRQERSRAHCAGGDRHAGEKLQKGQDNEVILFLTFFNRSVWLEIGEVFQTLLNRAREREAKKFW